MLKVVYRRKLKSGKGTSKLYTLRYRLPGMLNPKYKALRTTDKRIADKKAEEFLLNLQYEQEGMIPPESIRESAQIKLKTHLDDFLRDKAARGRDGRNGRGSQQLKSRISSLIDECFWNYSKDVNPSSFCKWRSNSQLAPKTKNHFLEAANNFFNWMVRNERITSNPLKNVEKAETKGKEQRLRRAASDDELYRLIDASGERGSVYLIAARTGLRQAELKGLKWSHLELDISKPSIHLPAAMTKNSKTVQLPLFEEASNELLRIRPEGFLPEDHVFPYVPRVERLKKDLALAGILYKDTQGRQLDFHALRVTFCTYLFRNGIEFRKAMAFMRHSDPKLTTQVYFDQDQIGLDQAVSQMSLNHFPTMQAPLIAPRFLDSECQNLSLDDQGGLPGKHLQPNKNKEVRPLMTTNVSICPKERVKGIEPFTHQHPPPHLTPLPFPG